jgi:hypothetical protein
MENAEFRIERLVHLKEDLEDEIYTTEKTIEELKELSDRIPIREISIKVSNFIKELENCLSDNKEIEVQIEKDIEMIRGIKDD